jgi:predicted N-acyltransferase
VKSDVYTYKVHGSIAEVDEASWRSVCESTNADVSMDPRMIAALEASLQPAYRFWHVVMYDAEGAPLACASLIAFVMDLPDIIERHMARFLRSLPRWLGILRYQPALLCGMPLSTGGTSLAMLPSCDSDQVFDLLQDVMKQVGKQQHVSFHGYKEFREEDLPAANRLLAHGYVLTPTQRCFVFESDFADFDAYVAALKTNYRKQIKASQRRLKDGGVCIRAISDTDEIVRTYDERAHDLYLALMQRATYKLEVMPHRFFIELAQRFRGHVSLLVAERDGEVLGCVWVLEARDTAYLMWVGCRESEENDALDLYFNLAYACLARAMERGFRHIELGQTADAFKARLGAQHSLRYVYLKGLDPVRALAMKYGLKLLHPGRPRIPDFNVFKARPGCPEAVEGDDRELISAS